MNEQEYKPASGWVQKFNLFAGVIMPTISITVEATTHICAENFFDPIPTMWHLMLVVFVPLAQLHVWFAIRRGAAPRPFLTGLVNAITIGISLLYSVIYLPLIPLAALTLLVGLGLLPLAPLLSLIASIVMRVQLQRVAARTSQSNFGISAPGLVLGLAGTALLIGAIELPASLTRYGLQLATSESAETRAEAIRFLRAWGSKEYLLRACYARSGRGTDLAGFVLSLPSPVTTAEAKQIYYRVTGETLTQHFLQSEWAAALWRETQWTLTLISGEQKLAANLKDSHSRVPGSTLRWMRMAVWVTWSGHLTSKTIPRIKERRVPRSNYHRGVSCLA